LEVGQYYNLKVYKLTGHGIYLEDDESNEILLPSKYSPEEVKVGDQLRVFIYTDSDDRPIVYMYLDDQDRLTGTTVIDRCLEYTDIEVAIGEEVELMIYGYSDFGPKVIINQTYNGQLYNDDIYNPVKIGQIVKGYIRKIRPDKKIDVTLRKFGYKKVLDETDKILELIENSNGFIPLHDKSSPEDIKRYLGMSKKVFKKAIGSLYKKKKIIIEKDGIRKS